MNPSLVVKIFSVVCIISWLLPATVSVVIHVSNEKPTDLEECGASEDDPCPTIKAAIQIAKEYSQINIKATGVPYQGCPFYVDKPLDFVGTNGQPVVDCGGKDAFTFNLDPNEQDIEKQSNIKLDVKHLKIQNSKTGFSFLKKTKNVNLRLYNVDFIDNDIDVAWSDSHLCYLVMTSVNAVGHSGYGIDIAGCNKTTMQITQTKFRGKYLKVVSTEKSSILDIKMDDVTFDMSERANKIESELESPLYIVTALERSSITFESCNFSHHLGDRHSMFNMTAFKGVLKKASKRYISRINVVINNTIFINNTVQNGLGGAISLDLSNTLTKKIKHYIIFNMSTFIGNTALRGGALWFSEWGKKTLHINSSTFIDNKATDPEDGGGGALYGAGGKVLIQFSKFDGNTATKYGGTLYLSSETVTSMTVSNSTFQNKLGWSQTQGDVMYLNKVQTTFSGNVVFNLTSSNSGEAIFSYDGIPTVLRMANSTAFICPRGYNYEEARYTIKLKPKSNKKRKLLPSYHIFAFTCKPCQDLFYTTGRGSWQVDGTTKRGVCHKCPHGASCNGTIRARANFWGRIEGDKIEMIPCPKGYCCNEEPCGRHDSCRAHRTGTLCGHCADGYTESMSSTQCFPNESCNEAWWLWPVINVIGIFALLSFHQEIIKKMVRWSLWTNNDKDESAPEYRPPNNRNREPPELDNELEDDEEINFNRASLGFRDSPPDHTRIDTSTEYNNSGGYIKVFYYFYQAVLLIRLSSYVSNSSFPNSILGLLTPLLNFQFTNIWTCAGEHWGPVTKVFVKNSVAYWVLGLSFLAYVAYRLLRKWTGRNIDDEPGYKSRSFPVRLTGTVIQAVLLSYIAQTQFTVQLLNCVHVGDKNVLFIDGSVTCFRSYQVFVWIHLVVSIVAFPFALLVGQMLLFKARISPKEFLIACFFPFFLLCRWGYKYLRHYRGDKTWSQLREGIPDPYKEKIKYILQYPYKSPKLPNHPSWIECCSKYWEVVLLLRRLILVIFFIFVKSFLLRAYLFFIVSMAFLLGHMFVQPFENDNVNKLDNVSLAVIVLISGLSISEATYNNAGQLLPYEIEMLQRLQDWFLALIPIVLLCVFFGPRAKFHILKWKTRRGNRPVSTEADESATFSNPGNADDTQQGECSRLVPTA